MHKKVFHGTLVTCKYNFLIPTELIELLNCVKECHEQNKSIKIFYFVHFGSTERLKVNTGKWQLKFDVQI